MSAYNFFFREERTRILSEKPEGEGTVSFEDIGRLVGERWRSIDDGSKQKFKGLASVDSERYRAEMKVYYNDELQMMCLGLGRKPDGSVASSSESSTLAAVSMVSSISSSLPAGTDAASGLGPNVVTSQNGLETLAGMASNLAPNNPMAGYGSAVSSSQVTNLSRLFGDETALRQILQYQSVRNSLNTPSDALVLILSQKAVIQQRERELLEELSQLRTKSALLDSILGGFQPHPTHGAPQQVGQQLGGGHLRPQPPLPPSVTAAPPNTVCTGYESFSTEQLIEMLRQQEAAAVSSSGIQQQRYASLEDLVPAAASVMPEDLVAQMMQQSANISQEEDLIKLLKEHHS